MACSPPRQSSGTGTIRQFAIQIDLDALLVFIGEDVAVVERILEFEAALANAGHIVRLPRTGAERIQFEQCRVAIGMIVCLGPVRRWSPIGKQCV
jgi:hypothetical protein